MNGAGDAEVVGVGPLWEAIPIAMNPAISARVGHSIVQIQTSSNVMHVFGGANEEHTLQEIWEVVMHPDDDGGFICKCTLLDTGTTFPGIYEFIAVPVSSQQKEQSTDQIWVFGGGSQDADAVQNDVLLFDAKTKKLEIVQVENSSSSCCPTPRTQGGNKCLVAFDGSKYLVVFGGGIKNNTSGDGNLYLFNIDNKTWSVVVVTGDAPEPRQGHIAASVGSKIFIHGGMLETSLFDDMHMIDMANTPHSWTPISTNAGQKPSARAAHNVVTMGQDLYIFGGLDSTGEALNDLWKFNTETFQWSQIHYTGHKVNPRVDFALASIRLPSTDSNETGADALILHGGVNPSGLFFDDLIVIRPSKP